jgi:hypothetical protein
VLGITLRNLPLKAKWLVTLVLFSFLLNHAFAALLVREVTTQIDKSAKEHFSFKSYAILLRMAHQHTFGHGVMYIITSAIFLLAEVADLLAVVLTTALFFGAWADIAGWFMLKYGSPRWEFLSIAAGTTYASAFLIMTAIIFAQLWRPRRRSS